MLTINKSLHKICVDTNMTSTTPRYTAFWLLCMRPSQITTDLQNYH